MIKHANKILYIGAGYNIEPVNHFPETREFVFIDTLPRSECETDTNIFNEKFYKPQFINDLLAYCLYYGFLLDAFYILDDKYFKKIIPKKWYYTSWFYKIPTDINPTKLVFLNHKTKQKIIYYISTNFRLNMNTYLQNDISSSDGIIVSNFLPHIDILNYFTEPKIFFGYTDTNYNVQLNSPSKNIIDFLYNCLCNTQYYFIEFYLVYKDSGVIIKCQDFYDFIKNIVEYDNEIKLLNTTSNI